MLNELEREKTHKITKELEEGCGSISLLLTISGTTASETISDLTSYEEHPKEKSSVVNRYVSDWACSDFFSVTLEVDFYAIFFSTGCFQNIP